MSAGYPTTLADVNNRAGQLVVALWTDLEEIHRFKLWLDDAAHDNIFLGTGGGLGMAANDITALRNSYAELGGASGLWAVAHGTFAPAGASNYFFNAKTLAGINYAG